LVSKGAQPRSRLGGGGKMVVERKKLKKKKKNPRLTKGADWKEMGNPTNLKGEMGWLGGFLGTGGQS